MGNVNNEGKCCDAVLRALEDLHGAERKILARDTPANPGVDIECTVGDQRYVLEHTLIEPFVDNERDGRVLESMFNADFIATLRPHLKAHLAYTITVDVWAFLTLPAKQFEATRAKLLEWAQMAAIRLPEPRGPRVNPVRGVPPETPVAVELECYSHPTMGGTLNSRRFLPVDPEARRRERLLQALQTKGRKLHATAGGKARTVLIAENRDIAVTSEDLVSAAFDESAPHAAHMPENIFLVNVFGGTAFTVTLVRCDGQACVYMGDKWEYKAAELLEL